MTNTPEKPRICNIQRRPGPALSQGLLTRIGRPVISRDNFQFNSSLAPLERPLLPDSLSRSSRTPMSHSKVRQTRQDQAFDRIKKASGWSPTLQLSQQMLTAGSPSTPNPTSAEVQLSEETLRTMTYLEDSLTDSHHPVLDLHSSVFKQIVPAPRRPASKTLAVLQSMFPRADKQQLSEVLTLRLAILYVCGTLLLFKASPKTQSPKFPDVVHIKARAMLGLPRKKPTTRKPLPPFWLEQGAGLKERIGRLKKDLEAKEEALMSSALGGDSAVDALTRAVGLLAELR